MKITKIESQVKTKGRYSVFVDDKFEFGLSELALINSGIKIGNEIDEQQLKHFKSISDLDKMHGRILDLLARRPRSEWEIRDYLKRKKTSSEDTDDLLNMLSKSGYVDDEEFARRWIENRRLLKLTTKRKLMLELKQKRISDQIIKKVLDEDQTDEKDVLKELIEKKRTQTRYKDDKKLITYLIGQGFNYYDIKTIINRDEQ